MVMYFGLQSKGFKIEDRSTARDFTDYITVPDTACVADNSELLCLKVIVLSIKFFLHKQSENP